MKERIKEIIFTKEPTDSELLGLNELVLAAEGYLPTRVYGNGATRLLWETPTGFPVEYICNRTVKKKYRSTIAGKQIKQVLQESLPNSPDMRGFMCGISPNFIHSMDASHMSLVIDRWDGDFGAVHDSFATHACDVDRLLQATKDTFIGMYDVDNFYDYIQTQLISDDSELDITQPKRGSLEIQEIQNSDYFFA